MPAEQAHAGSGVSIAARCDEAVPSALAKAGNRIAADFGDSVEAVLAYGSCTRDADPTDGLLDLYVLVSDYRAAYTRRWLRWANRILGPNVFYAEVGLADGRRVRVKYAVLSLSHFERGISRAFLPSLWGRFAQPVRLLWARSRSSRECVQRCLSAAALRLMAATHPLMVGDFTADQLWIHALRLSYATELRPEPRDRTHSIVAQDSAHYRGVTRASVAMASLPLMVAVDAQRYRTLAGRARRWQARIAWFGRRWLGRLAAVGRLMKTSLTFRGGVDYAAWKIERHTGTHVPVTERLRRHPLIFGWGVLWRLLRQRRLG